MGYIYDSVVTSLGGKPLTTPLKEGVLVRGWSPNMFKRIAILTDGIVIEYHGTTPRKRVIPFDINKVGEDLASGGKYKNPLRPLFEFKALSCLEEVIISETLVDSSKLTAYISTLKDTHRLRVVTLAPINLRCNDLSSLIEKLNQQDGVSSQLLSNYVSGSKVAYTSPTEDYYTKFYLRPSYYELDSDGGILRKYFELVKKKEEEKNLSAEKRSLISKFISNDSKDLEFWREVYSFLKNKENNTKYKDLYAALYKSSVANESCYVEGVSEYVKSSPKSPLSPIYIALGYAKVKGVSSPKENQQGFLRPIGEVVGSSYQLALEVVSKSDDMLLNNLKFPKDSSKLYVLKAILSVLNSTTVGTDNEEISKNDDSSSQDTTELKNSILSALPEELMISLFDVWDMLKEEYSDTLALLLSARGTGYAHRFSEKELSDLGLGRHAETLALLGYCGGSDDLSLLSSLSFSRSLDSVCRTMTKSSLSELLSKSWESLSDVEKCNYIIRRA